LGIDFDASQMNEKLNHARQTLSLLHICGQ